MRSYQEFERIKSALQSTRNMMIQWQEDSSSESITQNLDEAQENYINALSHVTSINQEYLRTTLEK